MSRKQLALAASCARGLWRCFIAVALPAMIAGLVLLNGGCASTQKAIEAEEWKPLSGLLSGRVNVLAAAAFSPQQDTAGRPLYAAVEGGVYKSTNGGKTWIACNRGLSNRLVRTLVLDPDRADVLYAGTRGGRVYMTEDGGGHWRDISQGIVGEDIVALAVDPDNPGIIYAATPDQLYVTTDAAGTWQAVPFSPARITAVTLAIGNPSLVYVATADGHLYYSSDRGATWLTSLQAGDKLSALVSTSGGALYALSNGKVLRSDNQGRTWAYMDNYLYKARGLCLAIHPRNPRQVLVGTTEGVHKSDDGRQTWYNSSEGLPGTAIQALAYDPMETETLYAAAGATIYCSNDQGRTWQERGRISSELGGDILVFAPLPQDSQKLFASVGGAGLYRSSNGGQSWELLDRLPSTWVTAIALTARAPDMLYAGTLEGVPYQSQDGGQTWVANARGLDGVAIRTLAVDPEKLEDVYLGTWGNGLYVSQGWEHPWTRVPLEARYVRKVAIDTRLWRRDIYVLTEKGTYRASYDRLNVLTMQWFLGPMADLLPALRDDKGIIVAGDPSQIQSEGAAAGADIVFLFAGDRSRETTQKAAPILLAPSEIRSLAQSPIAPNTVYAAVEGQGVLRSDDLGQTWQSLGSGLEKRRINALAAHPAGLALYAATDQGVYWIALPR